MPMRPKPSAMLIYPAATVKPKPGTQGCGTPDLSGYRGIIGHPTQISVLYLSKTPPSNAFCPIQTPTAVQRQWSVGIPCKPARPFIGAIFWGEAKPVGVDPDPVNEHDHLGNLAPGHNTATHCSRLPGPKSRQSGSSPQHADRRNCAPRIFSLESAAMTGIALDKCFVVSRRIDTMRSKRHIMNQNCGSHE